MLEILHEGGSFFKQRKKKIIKTLVLMKKHHQHVNYSASTFAASTIFHIVTATYLLSYYRLSYCLT